MADQKARAKERQRHAGGVVSSTVARIHAARQSGKGWWDRRCWRCQNHDCHERREGETCNCPECDRTGKVRIPWREFVALLAYCGDDSAREDRREFDPEVHDHIAGICHCGNCVLLNEGSVGWLRELGNHCPDLSNVWLIAVAEALLHRDNRLKLTAILGHDKLVQAEAAVASGRAWCDGDRPFRPDVFNMIVQFAAPVEVEELLPDFAEIGRAGVLKALQDSIGASL